MINLMILILSISVVLLIVNKHSTMYIITIVDGNPLQF